MTGDPRLTSTARAALLGADEVRVSPVTFFEIAQTVRLGKWPEMAPFLARLPALLIQQGGGVAALDPATALAAGAMAWDHRDPFDRLLAATALRGGMPIVSADAVFDGIVPRIW